MSDNGNGKPPVLIVVIAAEERYIEPEVWNHPQIWFAREDEITTSSQSPDTVCLLIVNNSLMSAMGFRMMARTKPNLDFQPINPIAMARFLEEKLTEFGLRAVTAPLPQPPPRFEAPPQPLPKRKTAATSLRVSNSGLVIICTDPVLVPNEAVRFFEKRGILFAAARDVVADQYFPEGSRHLIILRTVGRQLSRVESLARLQHLPYQTHATVISLWDALECPPLP